MINENNKDTWCVNAFHAMSGNNTGSTKICCMCRDIKYELKEKFLGQETIEQNFNQDHFIRVREASEAGIRHENCELCWQEEDAGRKSKRLRDNEMYLSHIRHGGRPFEGLVKFELNLGNTCNLKCRTCDVHSSSQWMKDRYDTNPDIPNYYKTYKIYTEEMKKYHMTYDDESPFWEDLENNLSTIQQFDFFGGEPFMSKKMWRILELCIEKGYAKDIELHYATNGTHWPEDKIALFKHFKQIHLTFSVDGVGRQFEYMRYLASWEEVQANMAKAMALDYPSMNGGTSLGMTLSNLNIYNLPELIEEYQSKYAPKFGHFLNLVHGPKHFNISMMPDYAKEPLIEKLNTIPKHYTNTWVHLEGVIGFIKNGKFDQAVWDSFLREVRVQDEYRGEKFADVFPEWAKILRV
jgi:hypothetical protein